MLKHDVVAQHSELAIEKSPISISLQRPNFATMINALHPGNRIGYRFHEHEPISYGNVPVSNKDASINIERIEAMEESYLNLILRKIHWQYTSHVTDHHPADCLHSIVNIGNIPPFSKKAIHGKIYWFEGNKDSLYDHYKHDLMDSGQQ